MQVELIRKDSLGIKGTYRNAQCHAQACLPIVREIDRLIGLCGFKKWKQGHNVHVFETSDGRKFDMIPYYDGQEYRGIEVRIRKSRSEAERLIVITDVGEVKALIKMLQMLAKPLPYNYRGRFKNEVN